ncbi:hypothetical protein, partial [Sphingomonas sp. Root1294]|uniref:hypothetical protein n=1 Tax=Sphingomonas sp. Root1294 TaxID=1736447 RepID=UPI001F465DDC
MAEVFPEEKAILKRHPSEGWVHVSHQPDGICRENRHQCQPSRDLCVTPSPSVIPAKAGISL